MHEESSQQCPQQEEVSAAANSRARPAQTYRVPTYGRIGVVVSLLIAILAAIYVYFEWEAILGLKPNEFGDLLAGVLGPLAILWLILGFFQQSEELRHSVRALELQSEELRNSVEQQAALVEVTRAQAEAELTALQEERLARRAATSPQFTVYAAGGSRSGKAVSQTITLINMGARAADVRIIIRSDKSVLLDRFFSVFEDGHTERLSIDFNADDRPDVLSVNLLSKTRFGEEVKQVIRLTADPQNLTRYSSDETTI